MRRSYVAINVMLSLMLLVAGEAFGAGKVAVIVNSSNGQGVTLADIKSIYSDQMVAWQNGNKIDVYNLPPDDVNREVFARKVLSVSAQDAAAAESNRRITNSARNPQEVKRDKLVASIVSRTPGAIGYVPVGEVEGKIGIRVVMTLE